VDGLTAARAHIPENSAVGLLAFRVNRRQCEQPRAAAKLLDLAPPFLMESGLRNS
jgi:hypothetical protein